MSRSHTKARRRDRQRQGARRLASLKRALRSGRLSDDDYQRIAAERRTA